MKTRDLFADCFVRVAPHDDLWLVSLSTDEHLVVMKTYGEVPNALEAVQEWMFMLSDETEITADRIRETLARLALGETVDLPKALGEIVEHDEFRTWFDREMEKSRHEEG